MGGGAGVGAWGVGLGWEHGGWEHGGWGWVGAWGVGWAGSMGGGAGSMEVGWGGSMEVEHGGWVWDGVGGHGWFGACMAGWVHRMLLSVVYIMDYDDSRSKNVFLIHVECNPPAMVVHVGTRAVSVLICQCHHRGGRMFMVLYPMSMSGLHLCCRLRSSNM